MTKPKVDIDPTLVEATEATEAAIKARAKAAHSTSVVHISTQALALATAAAADHDIEATEAEKKALDAVDKAHKSMREQMGLSLPKEPEKVEKP